MGFGSLGISELVVIFVIVLVFFGPRRFPEIARSMGSAMREFRRSLNQIQRELEEVDPRKDVPGLDILKEFRTGKPGNWLDPNRTSAPDRGTPGSRSAPETPEPVTGEGAFSTTAGPPPVEPDPETAPPAETPPQDEPDGGEQLPMFDGSPEPSKDDSRSG